MRLQTNIKENSPKKPRSYQKLYQKRTIPHAKNRGQKWTDEERLYVKQNAGKLSVHHISKKLKRTYAAVQAMAYELNVGLRKESDEVISCAVPEKKSLFVIRRPSDALHSVPQQNESESCSAAQVTPDKKAADTRKVFEEQFNAWSRENQEEAEQLLAALEAWANALPESLLQNETLWTLMAKQFERLGLSKHEDREQSARPQKRELKFKFMNTTDSILWLFRTPTARAWMERFRSV